MKKPRRPAAQPLVKSPASDVVLWRPKIVLASRVETPTRRQPVTLAGQTAHPDAGEPRFVGSIFSLADAGATLAARAADARARAAEAASAQERVSATMAAYRLEASFDETLTGTYRQVSALMEERGLA
ncbi:MAG TPA: hypothetical protein VGT02_09540 [Methylomirabilota bacterium]|jgi:hypothetical protein|nr:hypothetical protein [Methylomirabilota bacterium]